MTTSPFERWLENFILKNLNFWGFQRLEILTPELFPHVHPLANDPFILKVVQGYDILFLLTPFQKTTPILILMNQEETVFK